MIYGRQTTALQSMLLETMPSSFNNKLGRNKMKVYQLLTGSAGGASATGGRVGATGGRVGATGGRVGATGGRVGATGSRAGATGGRVGATGGRAGATRGRGGATRGRGGATRGRGGATIGRGGATRGRGGATRGRGGRGKRYVPPYNPAPWSASAYIERCNNCYNYVNLKITNTTAQPGAGSGQEFATCTASQVEAAAIRDGLRRLNPQPAPNASVPGDPGGTRHLVALVVDPGERKFV